MRQAVLLSLTLLAATSAPAQSSGYYEPIPYYGNDPFKFCTVGVPWDCWAPISPQLGTFTVTNQYCFNPVSAVQYARVCPKAFQAGALGSLGSGGQDGLLRTSQSRDPANASP